MDSIVVRIAGLDSPSLRRIQRLVFILVGVPLLLGAWERLQGPGSSDAFDRLLVAALLTGAAVDLVMAMLVDRLAVVRSELLDRVPFAITGVLCLLDAVDKMRHGSHALHVALFVTGVLNLALAGGIGRLRSRRAMTADGAGIAIQRSRLRRVRLAWTELEALTLQNRSLRFETRGGRWLRVDLHTDETIEPRSLEAKLRDLWAAHGEDGPR